MFRHSLQRLSKYVPAPQKLVTDNSIGITPPAHVGRKNPLKEDHRAFNVVNGKMVAKPGYATSVDDNVTHTGQYYDSDDLRNVRYVKGTKKTVNPNWAIDLIDMVPPIAVKGNSVGCMGHIDPVTGEDTPLAMGHPKVWINLTKGQVGCCNYCGLRYFNEDYHDPWAEEYPEQPK